MKLSKCLVYVNNSMSSTSQIFMKEDKTIKDNIFIYLEGRKIALEPSASVSYVNILSRGSWRRDF